MQKTFDAATGQKTWHLTQWHEKTCYVLGIIYFWLVVAGIIIAILES